MNIGEILLNGASGGILGSALHCVTDYWDTKNKVSLMNAQVAAAEKTEAWKAFAASQASEAAIAIPPNTPTWVSSIYLCVDSVKQLTRPLLTWSAIVIILTVFLKADPAQRNVMSSEILFGSFTAIFWWFGARYAERK